jgi:predicted DNA-binding transcriptional regulator AlpA
MAINQVNKEDRLSSFDELPDQALLSAREVSQISGRSRTSLWRDVMRGFLAAPVKIGSHTVKWRVSDVRQFLNGGEYNGH